MSVKDVVDQARGSHERARDRLEREATQQTEEALAEVTEAIEATITSAWLTEFGDLSHQPSPEEALAWATTLRVLLASRFQQVLPTMESIAAHTATQAAEMGRQQAEQAIEALYG